MGHLLRLCQHVLGRLPSPPVRTGTAAGRGLSAADHKWMRQACQTSVEMVRAVQEPEPQARIFTPSPVDQMYQGAALTFTYFYKGHGLQPALMKRALRGVLGEVPHLAGRGRLLGKGSRLIDSVIECNNEGVEFVTARARNIRLEDVGPHTWGSLHAGRKLEDSPMPFYGTPLDPSASQTGKQAPMRIKLTDLADGQVLSLSGWHAAVDAGSSIKLVTRLAAHYRSCETGEPVGGSPLRPDSSILKSPEHFKAALEEDSSPPWTPNPVSTRMSLGQWLASPFQIFRSLTSRWDVHMLYLPSEVLSRVKAAALAAGPSGILSTNDAAQALLFTLVNDLRDRPLVPTSPQMFTVTADILHGRKLKDPSLARQYFGNAVEIVFLEGGSRGLDPAQYPDQQALFTAALGANARRIRKGVAAYRADARPALDTMATYHGMVRIHKLAVAANFVVKGAEQKCCSASCITKFPVDEADFGHGAPHHMQVHLKPWCDWWYVYSAAAGIDDGKGVLVRMVLEQRLARRLQQHPVWRGLAHGAQLALAGETAKPFGRR